MLSSIFDWCKRKFVPQASQPENAYPNPEVAPVHSGDSSHAPIPLYDFEQIRASELKVVYNDSKQRCALIYPIGLTIEVCVQSETSVLEIETFTAIDVGSLTNKEAHLKGVELAIEWLKVHYPDISNFDDTHLYPYWYKETSLPYVNDLNR